MARLPLGFMSYFGVALVISELCTSGAQHPGYVSVDCGFNGDSYDDNLGISWDNDNAYVRTGTNVNSTLNVDLTIDNYLALQTFRYFPEVRNKHCYNLPTSQGNSSLIRAMFFQGQSEILTLPIMFNVSINAATWFSVEYVTEDADTLNTPQVFEGLFYNPANVTNICLLPVRGVPFISSLEMRPAPPQPHDQYLWTVIRWNTGALPGAATVRYPADAYDKLWTTPTSLDSSIPSYQNDSLTTIVAGVANTAWMMDTANSTISPPSYPSIFNYDGSDFGIAGGHATLSFDEISPNSTASTVRGMSIDINGAQYFINVSESNGSNLRAPLLSVSTLNFTFSALPWSPLGPIVNSIEVYAQVAVDSSATAATDVAALAALQTSCNLEDWQGDPCLPVPWNWLACAYNSTTSTTRVKKLLLSNMGISSTIPQSISQLDALTEIHFDNNNLNGPIPEFLTILQFLTVLLLNNNNLSGDVPLDLIDKNGLQNFTYFGNPLLNQPPHLGNSKKESSVSTGIVIGSVVGGLVCLVVGAGILIWYQFFRRRGKAIPATDNVPKPLTLGKVSLETVRIATNNFANKIGTGGYGSVYLGNLNGNRVAVKVNNGHSDQRSHEFINEVDILTRVHHKNLVTLLGYCNDGTQLILIYEYQANGSLREWLHARDRKLLRGHLNWTQRLQIAVDAAKGLEYLHNACVPNIIHRDVKSSNILLDENLVGKVSDFGVSKITVQENYKSGGFYTAVKGTYGYLDPEYFETSKLTHKSDVYSFGVVLVEIITGQPPFTMTESGSFSVVTEELQSFVERADIGAIADPSLNGEFALESMWRVVDVALSCVKRKGDERPDITEVVRNLDTARRALYIESTSPHPYLSD